jgi:hypothetical protein
VPDESVWKRRFALYTAARMGGLGIFLLGLAIAYSNLVRPGGWPQVGAVVAILGVVDAVFAPRLLKRAWDREDAGEQ